MRVIKLTKQDDILKGIMEIKVEQATTNQHLKNLNGQVKANEDDLKVLKPKVNRIVWWEKLKSVTITVMGTIIGFLVREKV